MCNLRLWLMSSLWVIVAAGTAMADDIQEQLPVEFLQYLAEFSDEEGDVLDPEMLADFMRNHEPGVEQKSVQAGVTADTPAEEVAP